MLRQDSETYAPLLDDIKTSVIKSIAYNLSFGVSIFLNSPILIHGVLMGFSVWSSVFLVGISYGILNDIIACYKNVKYFREGHRPGQENGLVNSYDIGLNAISWGAAATSSLASIFGFILGFCSSVCYFFASPVPTSAYFLISSAMFLMIPFAELYSISCMNERKTLGTEYISYLYTHSNYWRENKNQLSTDTSEQNFWLGNSDRNLFGYISSGVIGLSGLALSIYCAFSGSILFDTFLSVPMSFALTSIPDIIVGTSFLYMFKELENLENTHFSKSSPKV